jgi:hypothetical protein
MKQLLIVFVLLFAGSNAITAQVATEKPKIYHPNADARKEIDEAVARAATEHKHVLLQIGGTGACGVYVLTAW